MKIYTQDHGVYGSILVIAENLEAATQLISNSYNYDPKEEIEEYDIVNGFVYENLGDR